MTPSPVRRIGPETAWVLAVGLVGLLPVMAPVYYGAMRPEHVLPRYGPTLLALLAAYGLTVRWVVPCLLLRGRVGAYLLATVGLTLAVTFSDLALGLRHGPMPPPTPRPGAPLGERPALPPGRPRGQLGYRLELLTATLLVMGVSAAALMVRHTRHEGAVRLRLEQEKNQAELALLRAQLNPHLFFNTLNSIYWLTGVDAEKARLALYRLSRLMRYVLYQTQGPTVLLSQEIQLLHDYVGLMQLRLTPNMTLDFAPPPDVADCALAPLLLLPFLENAFKHGVSTDEPATIRIALHQAADTLTFTVRNRIFAVQPSGLAAGSGIGLVNTRRRLDLLYPGRYTLTVGPDPAVLSEFVAQLTLVLTD